MAKLYFRYGVVGSAKTLNLLAVAHNYKQQGKKVLLVKPALDTRFAINIIGTRAGLQMPADIVIEDANSLNVYDVVRAMPDDIACILVDEVQFLPVNIIDQLHAIAHYLSKPVPVICYGLRSDFRKCAFPAATRLFELADSIEEIKTTCAFCNRKAVFNLKFLNGKPTVNGPSVELGFEEKYLPACANCYADQHAIFLQEDDMPTETPTTPDNISIKFGPDSAYVLHIPVNGIPDIKQMASSLKAATNNLSTATCNQIFADKQLVFNWQ